MSNGEKGRAEGRIERFSIVYINSLSLSLSFAGPDRETLELRELYVQACMENHVGRHENIVRRLRHLTGVDLNAKDFQ